MTAKHIVIDGRIRRSSTGRYTDRLIEHLQNLDQQNTYTILVQPDDPWRPTAANFKTEPCVFPQFSFNLLHDLQFTKQLRSLKPDLVHFTMTQQPLTYLGNIVTTTHDLTMFHFVRRGTTPPPIFAVKMLAYRLLFSWSHAKSQKIIVPTQYVAKDLANYQPSTKQKINVTYEASELGFANKAEKPIQISTKDQFIMYLGNAFPHKNLPKLIDAFAILKNSNPKLKLVLVGKKDIHYQELEAYAKNMYPDLGDDVIITGFLPDPQAKWLFQNCQAYIFPSLSEGFGLPGLEAMANGAPVVSSNATCLPEVYGNAAHYFDPNSPEDIAAKITQVITDKKLRQQLINNGQKQLNKYSWKKMAKQTLTIYQSLLKTN